MPRVVHDRDLAKLRSKVDKVSATMVKLSQNGHYNNGSGDVEYIFLTGDNEVS